jgi:UDP-N-acetyl-D-glucosamine dehydrogenase
LTPQYLSEQDCVVIVTDHSAVDWSMVLTHSRLVVDPRNALGKIEGSHEHVIS